MIDPNQLEGVQKYLYSRSVFRQMAEAEFFRRNPATKILLDSVNEYVALVLFSLSDKDLRSIPNCQYIGDLIVSFIRTHFIISDLVVCSELIEASTLLRKQLELLARLNELREGKSAEQLKKRVPNLNALQTKINVQYGAYSEIAHSSHLAPLQMLGSQKNSEDNMQTLVFPEFQEDSYVCLQHIVLSVFEFGLCMNELLNAHDLGIDSSENEKLLVDILPKLEAVYGSL
jgi:hypothetical protein